MSDPRFVVAQGLAAAFLGGEWEPGSMTRRGQRAVGQRRVWVRELAAAAWHAYPEPPRDRPRELAAFLAACSPLRAAFTVAQQNDEPRPTVRRWFPAATAMANAPWPVVPLHTTRDLGELLGLRAPDLLWFADTHHLERSVSDDRLRHYRYHWLRKPTGGLRLIEEPKPLLKHFQRVVLREVLDRIPVHAAAHGFRRGHSGLTYAAGHVGQRIVIHLDLEDFFTSIEAGRVYGIFRRCGYPEPVAHLLTGLSTNSISRRAWAEAPRPADAAMLPGYRRLGRRLAQSHLPQGAPTSPAIANLAAFRLDRRLSALAGALGMTYTRYADDLALSSPRRHTADELSATIKLITRIATAEGFRINPTKTSIRRAGQRQQLAGIVVNERPNVNRREYERLKATLHNAARFGPTSQNRGHHPQFRAQLLGRISWVRQVHPERGDRLLATFADIDWSG